MATIEFVTIWVPLWIEAPPVRLDASEGAWKSTMARRTHDGQIGAGGFERTH